MRAIVVLACVPLVTNAQADPRPAQSVSVDAFRVAVGASRAAADLGDVAESLSVVRKHLEHGPRVHGDLSVLAGMLTGRTTLVEMQRIVEREVAASLLELEEAWRAAEFPPGQVYETLRAVVLPESQSGAVFPYQADESPLADSLGRRLVDWALRADRQDDLRAELELRSADRTHADAVFLLMRLALAEGDAERVRWELRQIDAALRAHGDADTAAFVMPALLLILGDEVIALEALPTVERAAELLPASSQPQHRRAATLLLKQAARGRYEQFDPDGADRFLQKLLEWRRSEAATDPTAEGRWRHSEALCDVAWEYLRAEQLDAALTVLGEVADLGLPFQESAPDGLPGALGALHRRLAELRTQERYRVLHAWSLPREAPTRVRLLSTLTPHEAPPPVFARALGERPQPNTFALPQTGSIPGVFSTGWSLVTAAADSGNLRALTAELSGLSEQNAPGARFLLLLAQLHQARDAAEFEQIETAIGARVVFLEAAAGRIQNPTGVAVALDNLVLAAACLERPELRSAGERLLNALAGLDPRRSSPLFRPCVMRAQVASALQRGPGSEATVTLPLQLAHWIPLGAANGDLVARGAVPSSWVGHEDHIVHLTGSARDAVCFRYPLAGEFEFSFEVQHGGQADLFGGAGFAGLELRADRSGFQVQGLPDQTMVRLPFGFFRTNPWPTYQKVRVSAGASELRVTVNGHPVWSAPRSSVSEPWLTLCAPGDRTVAFRNLQIRGEASIPRVVDLLAGDSLRNWNSFREEVRVQSHAARGTAPAGGVAEVQSGPADWTVKQGVLRGHQGSRRLEVAAPRLLSYVRPLQNGESIEYEFLHEPERFAVHPAVGRLALLLEPDGVRLRWVTSESQDWSGLLPVNNVVEPLNRRGDRALPLRAGEWNRVRMTLEGDVLTLSLNETFIYERPLEPGLSRRFGFYYEALLGEARVRNVLLRGDWPQALAEGTLGNLARVATEASEAERQAIGALLADRHTPDSALQVHQRAAAMSAEARYRYLSAWVLPGSEHASLRLGLDFTPCDPAPPVLSSSPLQDAGVNDGFAERRRHEGGELVCPALDLIAVAGELGRLDEVRKQVAAAPEPDEYATRCKLALLFSIDVARKDYEPALTSLFELFALVETGTHTDFASRWPETLAVWSGVRDAHTRNATRELLYHVLLRQVRPNVPSGSEAWRVHWFALAGLDQFLSTHEDAAPEEFGGPAPLKRWSRVGRTRSDTRGEGFPRPHWEYIPEEARVVLSTHHDEYLYYDIPLRGDFAVECDLTMFSWRDTCLMVAGRWVAPKSDRKSYSTGMFRLEFPRGRIDPPLGRVKSWTRYRAVVSQGVCSTYFVGRKIHMELLPEEHDPWLAIRSPYHVDGLVRNLRITGNPVIPESISLSEVPELTGWLSYFKAQSERSRHQDWSHTGPVEGGGMIIGHRSADLPGTAAESLLRYHRPMREDGTIEYEFFYHPNEIQVHPALDRAAFLLEPEGVRLHWITDGVYDRTGLDADNRFDEPECQRGARPLPLKPGTWNRMALTLTGDTVSLRLNDELVFERELEASNDRTFGLFHYSDVSEARVRNVVWHGGWPKELPPLSEQELAGEGTEYLDERLPELTAVFEHDFAAGGLPMDRFSVIQGSPEENFGVSSQGLQVSRQGGDGYNNATIAPRLQLHGDFDVTVDFDAFEPNAAPGGTASLILVTMFQDPLLQEAMVYRREIADDRRTLEQIYQAAIVSHTSEGTQRQYTGVEIFEATAGRFRIARRGKTVYCLIAEGDSPNFRLVRSDELTDEPVTPDGLRMLAQTSGPGRVSVVWKRLSVRAERLTGFAVGDGENLVAELDRERAALPASFAHDFAKDLTSVERFHRWSVPEVLKPSGDGLRVTSLGRDQWTSAGLAPHVTLRGDFDVTVRLEFVHADVPKSGDNSSAYLQVELGDQRRTQNSIIYGKLSNGEKQAAVQIRVPAGEDMYSYMRLRSESLENLVRMRIARRGTRLYFLIAGEGEAQDRLLGQFEASDAEVPDSHIRLLVHTGGAERETTVLWKALSVRAEEVEGPR